MLVGESHDISEENGTDHKVLEGYGGEETVCTTDVVETMLVGFFSE
jgi:hypothetical protein